MFPIGDAPNPKGFAWMNTLLIAINVAVFLFTWPLSQRPADPNDPNYRAYIEAVSREARLPPAELQALDEQVSEYDMVVFEHGLRPAQPSAIDMQFSMFLHGGLMHLFGNMLFLWIYGNNVEFRLGPVLYLLAYLATGFAAGLGDILLRPGSNIPAVGPSGAISGVLGMYLIWFPHNRVRMLLFLPPLAVRPFELPAPVVLLFYIVGQNLVPALLGGGGATGVAYGAHLDAARVLLEGLGQPSEAYQHLYRAMQSSPAQAQVEEVRRLMAAMQEATRTVPMRMPGRLRFQA